MNNSTFYNNTKFLLMGFFVFSSLSSTIIIDYLHFPMSLPEVLFMPFLILLKKKFKSVKVNVSEVFVVLFVCFFLVLIGYFYEQYSLFSMLSSARAWIYLLLCIIVFKHKNSITNSDLLWLCFGSIAAWFVDSQISFWSLMMGLAKKYFVVTFGLYLAVPILLTSCLFRKKYVLFVISIVIISGTIIYACVRRLLAITVIALFFAIFLSLKNSGKRILPYIILSSLLISGFMISIPTIGNFMEERSYGMYYRIFVRTESMTGELSSSDTKRQNNFTNLAENLIDYTIPRGMVSLKPGSDKETGVFNDFPLYQLCWIFGWPIALIILGYFLRILFRNYNKFNKENDETSIISINCMIIMFVLLFLDGTFIEYPYSTPITGVILGRAILNAKSREIII